MKHDTFRIFQDAYLQAKKMPASMAFKTSSEDEKEEATFDKNYEELEKILAPILLD